MRRHHLITDYTGKPGWKKTRCGQGAENGVHTTTDPTQVTCRKCLKSLKAERARTETREVPDVLPQVDREPGCRANYTLDIPPEVRFGRNGGRYEPVQIEWWPHGLGIFQLHCGDCRLPRLFPRVRYRSNRGHTLVLDVEAYVVRVGAGEATREPGWECQNFGEGS